MADKPNFFFRRFDTSNCPGNERFEDGDGTSVVMQQMDVVDDDLLDERDECFLASLSGGDVLLFPGAYNDSSRGNGSGLGSLFTLPFSALLSKGKLKRKFLKSECPRKRRS